MFTLIFKKYCLCLIIHKYTTLKLNFWHFVSQILALRLYEIEGRKLSDKQQFFNVANNSLSCLPLGLHSGFTKFSVLILYIISMVKETMSGDSPKDYRSKFRQSFYWEKRHLGKSRPFKTKIAVTLLRVFEVVGLQLELKIANLCECI